MMLRQKFVTGLAGVLLGGTAPLALAQWPGFLGPEGNPVVARDMLPERFSVPQADASGSNVAWRRALGGRAVSGPIVVGDKVITTSSSAMEERWIHVTAVWADTGQVAWHRSSRATGRPYCHSTSANAAPTPCSDGQRVYALFSSNDLVCYDLLGQLVWYRSLVDAHPLAGNDVGMSSSPVLIDGVLVITVECQGDSFATGIDAVSGQTLWEIPRTRKANWSSPRIVTGLDGARVAVIHNSSGAIGVDPRSGKIAWQLDERCSTIATAAHADAMLYLPADGLAAYRLTQALGQPELQWRSSRLNPSTASPLVVPGLGVLGLNRSVLVCCDFEGQLRWQTRLPDAGQFWATPLVAGRRLYAIASNGKCFVVDLEEEAGRLVAECDLGCEVLGSPAVDDQGLYVRSVDALWKIARLSPPGS